MKYKNVVFTLMFIVFLANFTYSAVSDKSSIAVNFYDKYSFFIDAIFLSFICITIVSYGLANIMKDKEEDVRKIGYVLGLTMGISTSYGIYSGLFGTFRRLFMASPYFLFGILCFFGFLISMSLMQYINDEKDINKKKLGAILLGSFIVFFPLMMGGYGLLVTKTSNGFITSYSDSYDSSKLFVFSDFETNELIGQGNPYYSFLVFLIFAFKVWQLLFIGLIISFLFKFFNGKNLSFENGLNLNLFKKDSLKKKELNKINKEILKENKEDSSDLGDELINSSNNNLHNNEDVSQIVKPAENKEFMREGINNNLKNQKEEIIKEKNLEEKVLNPVNKIEIEKILNNVFYYNKNQKGKLKNDDIYSILDRLEHVSKKENWDLRYNNLLLFLDKKELECLNILVKIINTQDNIKKRYSQFLLSALVYRRIRVGSYFYLLLTQPILFNLKGSIEKRFYEDNQNNLRIYKKVDFHFLKSFIKSQEEEFYFTRDKKIEVFLDARKDIITNFYNYISVYNMRHLLYFFSIKVEDEVDKIIKKKMNMRMSVDVLYRNVSSIELLGGISKLPIKRNAVTFKRGFNIDSIEEYVDSLAKLGEKNDFFKRISLYLNKDFFALTNKSDFILVLSLIWAHKNNKRYKDFYFSLKELGKHYNIVNYKFVHNTEELKDYKIIQKYFDPRTENKVESFLKFVKNNIESKGYVNSSGKRDGVGKKVHKNFWRTMSILFNDNDLISNVK